MNTPPNAKSIYARGADCGLWLGLCFIAIFLLSALSLRYPLLNIGALAAAIAVPVISYRFLRRTHTDAHGLTTFSALWLQGIVMFACGALLMGAVAFVYMRFINPGFIAQIFQAAADYYSDFGTPEGDELATQIGNIIKHHRLPRISDFVLMWIWGTVFSGSVLCMILAAVARSRRIPPPLK